MTNQLDSRANLHDHMVRVAKTAMIIMMMMAAMMMIIMHTPCGGLRSESEDRRLEDLHWLSP